MVKSTKEIKPPKALSEAGVNEAIELVEELAFLFAYEELLAQIDNGDFGPEIKTLVEDNYDLLLEKYDDDKPLADPELDATLGCLSDMEDDWLERLAVAAGPMIAKIWHFSKSAGVSLSEWIYFRTSSAPQYNMVFDDGTQNTPFYISECSADVSTQIQKNRMYMDVTDLSFKDLQKSYSYISKFRNSIGIHAEDMREGAPNSIDVKKALDAYDDKCGGMPAIEIAKKHNFKIYSDSISLRSYPLLLRYLKLGEDLDTKLRLFESEIFKWRRNIQN